MKKLAWSFSALSTYETCPKKFYHLKIAKDFKDGDSEAAAEGKEIHEALFRAVIQGEKLPIKLRRLQKLVDSYRQAGDKADDIQGELKLCLSPEFEPVDWFNKRAWVRAVVDLLLIKGSKAILVDYKTGKRRDDFSQLELSAAILSRYMPEIEEFHLTFEWLRDNERSLLPDGPLRKSDMKQVWLKFLPKVNEIEEARAVTEFPAKPSGLCGWCPVTSCPHWVDRDDR